MRAQLPIGLRIGDYELGFGRRPMIIAELGASHNGSLDAAMSIVTTAHAIGADAMKLQCFLPETITANSDRDEFMIKDGPWKGQRLFDLYTKTHMPRAWFPHIMRLGRKLNFPIFASVFSLEDLDFMREYDPPAYKIASCELVDVGLIRAVVETGKPIILSTGMADTDDIDQAVMTIMDVGGLAVHRLGNPSKTIWLHCIAEYPVPVEKAQLSRMAALGSRFTYVGLSDHSKGPLLAVMATAMGAIMIEKHITLTPGGGGPDDGFAVAPDDFADFIGSVHAAHAAMDWKPAPERTDVTHKGLRRSLYVVEDMIEGQLFSTFNVRSIRPGAGLSPRVLAQVIGQRARRNIPKGTPLSYDLINHKES